MPKIEDALTKFKIFTQHDNRIQAYCPAHSDDNASLSILLSDKKILLYCHAGCQIEDILKSVELEITDLFLDTKPPIAIYQYRDGDGNLSHEKLKYTNAKGKRFTQRRAEGDSIVENLEGIPRVPYNYPNVKKAIKEGTQIVYVEGEKDANTARLLGYVATTMGGASDWRDEYSESYFRNAEIVLIPDKDDAGLKQADKVTKSLNQVCKSLKVVVLPEGKDLTEWVEAGNKNLKELINNSPDLVRKKGVPEPTMEIKPNGFHFDWNGLGLKIVIDRLKNDDDAEISVFDNDYPIYMSGIKLLSVSHKTSIARALKEQRNLKWELILNQVITRSLAEIRSGEPVIWLNEDIGNKRPEYLLPPLFIKNAANIIYADKSSAKSLFMTLIDIILSLPWHDNKLGLEIKETAKHTALFCDWENDASITGWQKECLIRGMDIGWCDLPYLHCSRPLHDIVDHIRDKIVELNADIIIIDSLGMAVGDDLNLTKPAFNFYNALRQLPITPIIIAHTAKDINNRRKTVYGNAYYENEARSVWEVVKEQKPGDSYLDISLFQRKAPPFAGYHEPLGFQFSFEGNRTEVTTITPANDGRVQTDERTIEDKILRVLMNTKDHLSPSLIAQRSEENIKEASIRKTLRRMIDSKDISQDSKGGYYYGDGKVAE